MPAASAAIMARSVSLAPRAGPHHRRARGCAVPLRLGPAEVTAANEDIFVAASLQSALPLLAAQVRMELHYSHPQDCDATVDAEVNRIVANLPPACRKSAACSTATWKPRSTAIPPRAADEVLLCYPFVTAVLHHRVAHELYKLGAPLVARIIAKSPIRAPASTSTPAPRSVASSSTTAPAW
jgi:hypothetical protein